MLQKMIYFLHYIPVIGLRPIVYVFSFGPYVWAEYCGFLLSICRFPNYCLQLPNVTTYGELATSSSSFSNCTEISSSPNLSTGYPVPPSSNRLFSLSWFLGLSQPPICTPQFDSNPHLLFRAVVTITEIPTNPISFASIRHIYQGQGGRYPASYSFKLVKFRLGRLSRTKIPIKHWSEIPGSAYSAVMDPELLKARRFMQEKIFHFLVQRQSERQKTEISQQRIIDLVKRLEEGLFRTAVSQEEYLNLDTLESRLYAFIKRPSSQSTSAPVETMMAGYSPGMSQHETGSSAGMHGVSTRPSDGIGNQNSSAVQSTGNQMGGGTGMRSYPSQDGSGNGGFGSYIQPLNGSGSSEN